MYVWADGVHFNVRLEEDRLCCLVIVGVRVDGTKELVAIADGYRESTESWADLLRDLKRRGMRAPTLALGDGALGFWGAFREVFAAPAPSGAGSTRSPTSSTSLPKSAQPDARRDVAEIRDAEDREQPSRAVDAFAHDYAAKWPKAVAKSSTTSNLSSRSSTSPPSTDCTSRPPIPSVHLRDRPAAHQRHQGPWLPDSHWP